MRIPRLGRRPVLVVLSGALAIAFSGILFRVADVSASTGAFYRCAFALPALWLLARWEDSRLGARPLRARALAWLAGAFLAADLVLWHNAIEQVGAGLATVLGNVQVVLVGLVTWLVLKERPTQSSVVAIPVVALGVVLISGVVESGAYGANPTLGAVYGVLTGLAYTGFLVTLREGNRDVRRPAGPLLDATLAGAVGCAAIGLVLGDLDPMPSWTALGWLLVLALTSQVFGWLLISVSLPRLPAALTSVMLTFQPLCSVVLAALILDESPSPLQLSGAACILAGLLIASVQRGREPLPEPEPAGD